MRGNVTCVSDLGRYLWLRPMTWSSASRSASSPRCSKASRRTLSISDSTWSSCVSASSILRRVTVRTRIRTSTAWQRRSYALKRSFARTVGRTTTYMSGVKNCARRNCLPSLVAISAYLFCSLLLLSVFYFWIPFWNKITRRILVIKFQMTQLLAQLIQILKKSKYLTLITSRTG